MIGDEFVDAEVVNHEVFVQVFPLEAGVTEALNAWQSNFIVFLADYSTYVDVMGHVAQPMLVAIVTGLRVETLVEDLPDEPEYEEDPEGFLLSTT